MDDLERAVLICLDPTAAPAVQARALEYCREVEHSPDGLSFALAHLRPSTGPEVAFWCLQLVAKIVTGGLTPSPGASPGPAQVARQPVLAFTTAVTTAHSATTPQPTFVRNKLAQLIALLVAADYPEEWLGAMREFVLPLASDETKRTPASIDLFFRVLRALDDDVTSIHAAQSSETARVISVRVKDAIRLDCTREFVQILATLVAVLAYADHAYDLVARNVEWLDITLFANDEFLPRMYASITSASPCPTRAASAFALRAILVKRMAPDSKMALLQHLQVTRLLSSIPLEIPADDDVPASGGAIEKLPAAELSIQSGRREIASLVNTIALSALEVLRSFVQGSPTSTGSSLDKHEMIQMSSDIAQAALPLALRFGSADAEDAGSQDALQCVTAYMSVFNRLNSLVEKQTNGSVDVIDTANGVGVTESWSRGREGIIATLAFIEEKACFPPDYNPADDEHPFTALRHVLLKSVLRNIARSLPSMVLAFIRRVAAHPITASSVSRTELVLTMLALLAESAPEEPGLAETLVGVMSNPPVFPPSHGASKAVAHQLDAVSIAHFDLVARCYRFILTSQDPGLLVSVLAPFVDSRGLRHATSAAVRSKAAYFLLKVTRPLRTFITLNHLADVIKAIEPLLFPLQGHDAGQVFTDQMNLYETAGYLVGTDTNRPESIAYLATLLNALAVCLSEASSDAQKVGVVTATGQLSKGFGGDSKPLLLLAGSVGGIDGSSDRVRGEITRTDDGNTGGVGRTHAQDETDVKVQKPRPVSKESIIMWTKCLEAVLTNTGFTGSGGVPPTARNVLGHELAEKVMFFLHRMIDTIGPDVVPYLNVVLHSVMQSSSSASDVRGIVVLASQAVGKFANAFEPVITSMFSSIVAKVGQFRAEIDPLTMLAMSEEAREAVELRKAYFYLIHAILSNDISQVLLAESNSRLLSDVVASLLEAVVGDKLDLRAAPTVMKMCTASLARMVAVWMPIDDSEDGRVALGSTSHLPAGFREFLINDVAPACVRSGLVANLFRTGDYTSGAASAVITENVNLQRICAGHVGPSFGESMRSRGFQSLDATVISDYIGALNRVDSSAQTLTKSFASIVSQMRVAGRTLG
jgi:hypothetical protein